MTIFNLRYSKSKNYKTSATHFLLLKTVLILFSLIFSPGFGNAQELFTISGKVIDQTNTPLSGASVVVHELKHGTMTDAEGRFVLEKIPRGEYHLHISFLGYMCIHYNLLKIESCDTTCVFVMHADDVSIDEVTVRGTTDMSEKRQNTLSSEIVNTEFINRHINSNLIKSIERLPGISAIDVGQGFSKPVIRGLSFNRVAVTENGVKQEGQQWGADHGLEIDQFGVESVEIIKGPSSLMYGSDAIGGVIQINPNSIAPKNTLEASFQSVYKSVNNFVGASAMAKYRHADWYFNGRYTHTNFGDYRVPADSFFYNRYRLPIYNNRLKNTAGTEQDAFFTVGVLKPQYKNTLTLSNVRSRTGFFPGSHGIPSAEKLFDDGNTREIDLPYQMVNHLKIINTSKFYLSSGNVELTFAYQHNFRQEWSVFHTHYPNQTAPAQNPDLELEFRLNTLSGDLKYRHLNGRHEFVSGISAQYQLNDIDGYIFLLPQYQRSTFGYFLYDDFKLNPNLILSSGLRFDFGQTHVSEYYSVYAENYKSRNFSANFYDLSWAVGLSYSMTERWNFKTHVGKSFRMPNTAELSANGVHHGSFRYEVGDSVLRSEYSYQLDAGIYYASQHIQLELSGFVNYFPNFIFLSPTGSYLLPNGEEIAEADAGQVYRYIQSEAFRTGGELSIITELTDGLILTTSAEYVYADDLTYPIPFTPPLNIFSELSYSIPNINNVIKNSVFGVNANFTAAQNRVARNELATPASQIYNASFSTDLLFRKNSVNIAVQIQNVFDTKYFNHLSFYRIIELPEPGRNVQIIIKVPFTKRLK